MARKPRKAKEPGKAEGPGKKRGTLPPRLALSGTVKTALADLIRQTAEDLTGRLNDYTERGLTNAQIVAAAQPRAQVLCADETAALVGDLLAHMVPNVLTQNADTSPTIGQEMIPGLDLPRWFAVPAATDLDGRSGWKRALDVTPNEIERIIEYRRADIIGRQVEMNKLVLWRATALDQGCDPDAPVSTVFGDDAKDRPAPWAHPSL